MSPLHRAMRCACPAVAALLLLACSPDRIWYMDASVPDAGVCDAPRFDPGLLGEPCSEGVGLCRAAGVIVCLNGDPVCDARPGPPREERCDGVDDDCDGEVDEDSASGQCLTGSTGMCARGLWACVGGEMRCTPPAGDAEVCNGVDDDCDGAVDEGFDTQSDVAHCGGCGQVCEGPGTEWLCEGGRCRVFECHPGRLDADGESANGCECAPTADAVELCNGRDDDCDGEVDDAPVDRDPPALSGVCHGVPRTCVEGEWHAPTYQLFEQHRPDYGEEVCDGLDNDCDDIVDEAAGCPACGVDDGASPCNGCPEGTHLPEGWVCMAPGGMSMGRRADLAESEDEAPVTEVSFTFPLYVSATEVTRADWQAVFDVDVPGAELCPTCPIAGVTWFDALAFANMKSVGAGLDACYTLDDCQGTPGRGSTCAGVAFGGMGCMGYRLPSEAEAERYIRGGSVSRYWFGDDPGRAPPDTCWDGRVQVCDSACAQPNAYGICHGHGNVAEWTHDAFRAYPGGVVVDPDLVGDGIEEVVVRSGDYSSTSVDGRSRARARRLPDDTEPPAVVGLRLVRRVPPVRP